MHAATFGGNPLAARAGIAAIEMIEEEGLQENARVLGERFLTGLRKLAGRHPLIRQPAIANPKTTRSIMIRNHGVVHRATGMVTGTEVSTPVGIPNTVSPPMRNRYSPAAMLV